MSHYQERQNAKSFEEIFNGYVDKNKDIWYLDNKIPTLSKVRGKIVLIRRFKASNPLGINATNWKDNTTFSIDDKANLYVQDCYKVSDTNHKWNEITNTLDTVASKNNNILYLNYTSGYKSILGIPNITTVSNDINNRLKKHLSQLSSKRLGTIIMDFADEDLCNKIIRNNL